MVRDSWGGVLDRLSLGSWFEDYDGLKLRMRGIYIVPGNESKGANSCWWVGVCVCLLACAWDVAYSQPVKGACVFLWSVHTCVRLCRHSHPRITTPSHHGALSLLTVVFLSPLHCSPSSSPLPFLPFIPHLFPVSFRFSHISHPCISQLFSLPLICIPVYFAKDIPGWSLGFLPSTSLPLPYSHPFSWVAFVLCNCALLRSVTK